MADIQVFDVYPYLHTAYHIPKYENYKVSKFPVGGMWYFLRKLTAEIVYGNKVACCFDGGPGKNPKMPGYKSNRQIKPAVVAQADYLFNFLSRCGVPCYRGFAEADDYIYNVVEANYQDLGPYECLNVWGSDYDLCHNVTEKNVFYKTVNKNTNNVSWMNFSQSIGLTDEEIYFNTISAYKVLCKDVSDSIKTFKCSDGRSGLQLYREYKKFWETRPPKSGRVTRRRDILEAFLSDRNLSDRDLKELKIRMDTVFPKDLTKQNPGGFPVGSINSIDCQLLADYCSVIKDKVSLSNLRHEKITPRSDEDLGGLISELYELGTDFGNGAFAADRNLSMKECNTFSETFCVREI